MHADTQSCSTGLSTVSDCTASGCGTRVGDNTTVITRIIPDMNFTCNEAVVKWRAAVSINYTLSNINHSTLLGIWRERNNDTGIYDKVDEIDMGICGNGGEPSSVVGFTTVYECTLADNLTVTTQPGDILGVEIAGNNGLNLCFDNTTGGPTNYMFTGKISAATLTESDFIANDQPQISLQVLTEGETGNNIGIIVGGSVGSIIAVLLVVVIILQLILMLRRQRSVGQKLTPLKGALVNSVYNGECTTAFVIFFCSDLLIKSRQHTDPSA